MTQVQTYTFEDLMGAAGHPYTLAKAILTHIETAPAEQQDALWKTLIGRCGLADNDTVLDTNTEDDVEMRIWHDEVDREFDALREQVVATRPPLDEVVKIVREALDKIEDRGKKIAYLAFVLFLKNSFVPYFDKYPVLTGEEFVELGVAAGRKQVSVIKRFAKESLGFLGGNTERAAAFLQFLDEEPNPAKKVLLMASVIKEAHLDGHECEKSGAALGEVLSGLGGLLGDAPVIALDLNDLKSLEQAFGDLEKVLANPPDDLKSLAADLDAFELAPGKKNPAKKTKRG